MTRAPLILRPLSVLLVAALIFGTLMGAIAPIFAADPSHTYYVAQSGTADEGNGTSCDAPDYVVDATEAAIQAAIDGPASDGDTIFICAGTYAIGNTIQLAFKTLTLQGAGAGSTILDGGGTTQILTSSVAVVVSGFTFQHGNSALNDAGGAVHGEIVTATASTFNDNSATNYGGAIYAGAAATVSGSTFTSNTAQYGGAINSSTTTVASSTFMGNSATTGSGGAIYATTATVTVTSSSFGNNSSGHNGGAIYMGASGAITSSSFDGNLALVGAGGAIFAESAMDSSVSLVNCSFISNTAESGGALYGGAVKATSTSFSNNEASAGPGGAIVAEISVEATAANFVNNVALDSGEGRGGAIITTEANIYSSSFDYNRAINGGAIDSTEATIVSSTFMKNTAVVDGGAIAAMNSKVLDSTFVDNAAYMGGALFVTVGGASTVAGSAFNSNTATIDGGAIHAGANTETSADISGSTFFDNGAGGSGQAIVLEIGRVCGLAAADFNGGSTPCDVTLQTSSATTYYVAQLGDPTPGSGTSCSAPDYVGTTDVAIQSAIDDSGLLAGGTIVVCAGTYDIGATLDLGGKLITLQGAGAGLTILDGGNTFDGPVSNNVGYQILTSSGGITLSDMTLENGYSASNGGAVHSGGTARVTASIFTSNVAAQISNS